MKETIKYLLPFIFCGIFFVLALNYCGKNKLNTDVIINKHIDSTIVYLKDTSTHTHSTTNIYTNPIFTVNPSIPVDTAKILKMFYTKYLLVDSLVDSLVKIKITDTLFNNKITYRQYNYNFIKPYQVIKSYTVTNTINNPNGFYVGAFTGFNKQVNMFGANALYIYKKNGFGCGYDFLNKNIQLNYLHKIGK